MDDKEEAYFLSQIPESTGSRFRASKISAVLRKVIQQKGYSAIQSADMLRNAWADAVGQSLASQTQVGKVERGQLTVLAANKVVASDLDGYRNVATHDVDSLLVPPGDPDALAGAIRRLMADSVLRGRLVGTGRERAAVFSMRRLAEAYIERYERVMDARIRHRSRA
jgi:glycosyltransferase involved in cell wall biosynthesis